MNKKKNKKNFRGPVVYVINEKKKKKKKTYRAGPLCDQ